MYLLLVAGLPASGKSTFAAWAAQRLGWPVLGKDDIKECLFDTIGFNCHEEKRRLDKAATMTMYYAAGQILARGQSVVLDNNFWEYSRPVASLLLCVLKAIFKRCSTAMKRGIRILTGTWAMCSTAIIRPLRARRSRRLPSVKPGRALRQNTARAERWILPWGRSYGLTQRIFQSFAMMRFFCR